MAVKMPLRDYARLLTSDTDACADLFADDAEFETTIGSNPVRLKGKEAIRDFLERAPRQLKFRVTGYHVDGDEHTAQIKVEGFGFEPVQDIYRCTVRSGKIARFRVNEP